MTSRTAFLRTSWNRFSPSPGQVLVGMLFVSLLLRLAWLSRTGRALIFDESYYVNAARVILHWPVAEGAPYAHSLAGIDPNHEHPPLGKLLLAGSMYLLGDNSYGWRLPSIVFGMVAIFLVYAIVRACGGGRWLAVLAATLFSFDNLVFVHSRIGTLDMTLVAFLLLGAWLVIRGLHLLGGAAIGLAALVKLGGLYGLGALLLFEAVLAAWQWRETRRFVYRPFLTSAALLIAGFIPVWLGGLWLLDHFAGAYAAPWDHINFMFKYGFALTRAGGPVDTESDPWQWLINDVQIPYLRIDQNITVSSTEVHIRPLVFFRGAMNPLLIGAAPLAIGYSLWRAWKLQERMATWALTWFAATYLPFFPLAMLEHRISYIFYFLPTIPAVAVAIAQLLHDARLPRLVGAAYLLAFGIGFIGYFPFRTLTG